MILSLLKWSLKNTAHGIMKTLLRIFSPILSLLLLITLLFMVLTYPAIQYPIKVESILGIWKINCLIPPTDAELMARHGRTSEGHESICIRAFPKENLILTHYMFSAWWLNLLDRLGH